MNIGQTVCSCCRAVSVVDCTIWKNVERLAGFLFLITEQLNVNRTASLLNFTRLPLLCSRQITGLYRAIGGASSGSTSGVFRTLIIANNVAILGKDVGRCAF